MKAVILWGGSENSKQQKKLNLLSTRKKIRFGALNTLMADKAAKTFTTFAYRVSKQARIVGFYTAEKHYFCEIVSTHFCK
ncbi:hypothetical protein DWB84_16275 [Saccharophagus sp. K07]|uniref:hypothetical protein n=1 Tax=Saccharophagus sp. K07 TaxID=2283636 RepID=UPI001651F3CD|nr:hypothetical protein [Saccharophagus sp. K07]MBC6907004.1 hypothetical protein [Saccharophagus sp. K07]